MEQSVVMVMQQRGLDAGIFIRSVKHLQKYDCKSY